MIIYIDENLSPHLAKGLDILWKPENKKHPNLNIEVKSIKETFGVGAKDEDWIPKAAGSCVITQDFNIKTTPHQLQLFKQHKLGMIFLKPPSKKGFSYWDTVNLVIKHWLEITKISTDTMPPFAYTVTSKSKLEKKSLN
jgi:hypothetical protein